MTDEREEQQQQHLHMEPMRQYLLRVTARSASVEVRRLRVKNI